MAKDDVAAAGTMPRFEFLGVDADWPHCGLCGRGGLEKTFMLRDLGSGEVCHYGRECVKKATGWTVTRWTRRRKAAHYAAMLDAAALEYRDCPERQRMLQLAGEYPRRGGSDHRCRNARRNAGYARAEIAARHRVKSRDIVPRLKQMRGESRS